MSAAPVPAAAPLGDDAIYFGSIPVAFAAVAAAAAAAAAADALVSGEPQVQRRD